MKKLLLMAAAVMMGTAAMADDVTKDINSICTITEVTGENTFAPKAEYYYVLYCGEETRGILGIDEGNSMDFLGLPSNLDVWPNGESTTWAEGSEMNSFGAVGEYQTAEMNADWAAAGNVWFGGGWNIYADEAAKVQAMPADVKFHIGVSSMKAGKYNFAIRCPGYVGAIQLDFGGALKADGTWYNIDVDLAAITDLANVQYKDFAGGYVASFAQSDAVVAGQGFSWDSAFFYGGKPETSGIKNVNAAEKENAPIYNLAGQRVAKNYKGIAIQNGKKFIVK